MYLPPRGIPASCARIMGGSNRFYAFRIVRIPKSAPASNRYRRIHPDLVALEELKNTNRSQLMDIFKALGDVEVRNQVQNDYIDAVLRHTVSLTLSLLPEDYRLVFQRLRQFPRLLPGYTSELNEGVRRISSNFNHKQIAIIIRSYAALKSRSISTITGLIKCFNKNIEEAEIWQLREVASGLATLRVMACGVAETFYKRTVSIVHQRLKGVSADDLGVFLNSFARQGVDHDEILHFVDIHAKRLILEASNRNVALITNAFARVDRHSPQLIRAVKERLHMRLHEFFKGQFEGESLSRDEGNFDKCRQKASTVADAAIGSVESCAVALGIQCEDLSGPALSHPCTDSGAPLNVIDVSMVFNALHKLEDNCDKLLNAYIPWVSHHIDADTPTLSLVLLAHAYSRFGIRNIDLFNRVAHVIIRRINTLNCQQLGLIALSFAKVGHNIPILFLRIADEVIYRGTVALKFKRYQFDFQSLEQLMQAFSRIGFKDQRLYLVLTTLLKERLRSPNGDELNGEILASMLSSMKHTSVEGFVSLATNAIAKSKDSTAYSTVALCRVLSALSRLNVKHSKVLEFMLNEAKARVNEFQIPLLVNTLKALAKLKCYNLTLIRESLKRCSLYLVYLSTHDIANLLSALSDYSFRNVSFLQKLIMCIKHRMSDFNRNQLHIIFTRLALLRTSDADLYRDLIDKLLEHQHDFNEIQLADICTCYIYVLVHFDYLQRDIISHRHSQHVRQQQQRQLLPDQGQGFRVKSDMEESHSGISYSIQGSTPLVEATNITEHPSSPHAGAGHDSRDMSLPTANIPISNLMPYGFNDKIIDVMLSHLGTKLDVATIFKVQTVHLYLELIRSDIYKRLSKAGLDVLHKCSCVKFSLAEYMLTSSSVHREISHFLNLMGVLHRNEVQFGPYLIDIVPETGANQRVAIEYDGPTHFYAETTMRTAKSILKHEILESAGWQVIHVPYQEWSQLVSAKQKIIYLNNIKMQYGCPPSAGTAVVPPSSGQKRWYSSALDRKRRYLQRINEEVLKQHMAMPAAEPDGYSDTQGAGSPSSTDLIVDQICNQLIQGNASVRDIDCEEGDGCAVSEVELTEKDNG